MQMGSQQSTDACSGLAVKVISRQRNKRKGKVFYDYKDLVRKCRYLCS